MRENKDPMDAEQEEHEADFFLGVLATAGGETDDAESAAAPEAAGRRESAGPFGFMGINPRARAPKGPDLSDSRIQQSVAATKDLLRSAGTAPEENAEKHKEVVRGAESALGKLAQEGERATFTRDEKIGLEMVVLADGTRPVLFVQDGKVDPLSPDARQWKKALESLAEKIDGVTQSVGSIRLPGDPPTVVGTGWALARSLIVTNRHVLQGLGSQDAATGEWTLKPGITVDFAGEFGRPAVKSFDVSGVAFAGPDKIVKDTKLDFTHLDMAVLRCAVGDDEDFPPALELESDPALLVGKRSIYVMGFPAKRAGDFQHVITDLFKDKLGFKRWAPGLILRAPGQPQGDSKHWVAAHDASTLGGNSGSCVVDFGNDGARVVGLHFGGRFRVDNFAHAVAKLKADLGPLGATYV